MPGPHKFHPSILREYDMRGIVGETLHEADAYALGLSFGTIVRRAGGKRVVCGRDGRLTSAGLQAGLIRGLMETGCYVLNVNDGPTPMTNFASYRFKDVDAMIMVTGSHNPANYNGFKMTLKRRAFYGADIQKLGAMAAGGDWDIGVAGRAESVDAHEDYTDRLLQDFVPGRPLKVVWDNGNGAAGHVLQRLVKKLPGTHEVLFGDIDGAFPNHHPDPTVDKNLADLRRRVVETKADLGIALDGDGDRIGAIDEKGNVIRADMLMALFAADVLKDNPGASIVADVKCSGALFDEIRRLKGNPIMWKTGHSLIKSRMAETGAPLAGELSGHIFFADKYYGYDDALYAGIRLLDILGASGKTISERLAHMPLRAGTPEMRIHADDDRKFAIVGRLKEALRKSFEGQDYTLTDIDGIRLDGSEGWLLLRPSNTEACLVARVEAQTPEILELLTQRLADALAGEHLGLPIENNH